MVDTAQPAAPPPAKPTEGYLSADDILNAPVSVEYLDVEVPEWEKAGRSKVRIRTLTADEALKFRADIRKVKDEEREGALMLRLVQETVVDGAGKQIFTREQVDILRQKQLRVLMRLRNEAMRHNGFLDEADAAKNG